MILLGTAGQETCMSYGSNGHHTGIMNTR